MMNIYRKNKLSSTRGGEEGGEGGFLLFFKIRFVLGLPLILIRVGLRYRL
jgi:hypothetical protein